MTTPPIGKMRARLTLQQASRVSDGGGGATVTWTPVSDHWAQIIPNSGSESVEADGLKARITHQIWVRYNANITPDRRFVSGARTFNILSVIDAEDAHRFQVCLVEERLP